MDQVKLKMNTDKTEFIIFGHQKQLEICLTDSIDVVDDVAQKTECIRYLGGYLDSIVIYKPYKTKMPCSFNKPI